MNPRRTSTRTVRQRRQRQQGTARNREYQVRQNLTDPERYYTQKLPDSVVKKFTDPVLAKMTPKHGIDDKPLPNSEWRKLAELLITQFIIDKAREM
jgi:hypothetical protein